MISQIGLVVNSSVLATFVAVVELFSDKFSRVNVLVWPSFTKIGTASVTNILLGRTAIAFCSPSEKLPACATTFIIIEEKSEEHTSELQSRENLVCRLLLEKK